MVKRSSMRNVVVMLRADGRLLDLQLASSARGRSCLRSRRGHARTDRCRLRREPSPATTSPGSRSTRRRAPTVRSSLPSENWNRGLIRLPAARRARARDCRSCCACCRGCSARPRRRSARPASSRRRSCEFRNSFASRCFRSRDRDAVDLDDVAERHERQRVGRLHQQEVRAQIAMARPRQLRRPTAAAGRCRRGRRPDE